MIGASVIGKLHVALLLLNYSRLFSEQSISVSSEMILATPRRADRTSIAIFIAIFSDTTIHLFSDIINYIR